MSNEVPAPIRIRGAWYVGMLALAALVHAPALITSRPLDDDETYLATMGRMLARGDRLYVGVVDRKPPLAIWAYRVLVPSDWSLRWIHIAAVVLVAINGWIVVHIALRLGANANTGLAAGSLAIVASALFGFADAHAANFEIWGLVPASLAVWCAVRWPRSIAAAVAAGAAVGIATNCKQPYVFTIIAVVAMTARETRIRGALAAGLGLAVVTVGIAGIAGWSPYWHWVWFDNGDYINVAFATIVLVGLRQTAIFVALQWPLVATVARFRDHDERRLNEDYKLSALPCLCDYHFPASRRGCQRVEQNVRQRNS